MDTRSNPRSRRSLLTAAAAAGGALVTQALVRPAPAAAASVELGAINTSAAVTTVRSTQDAIGAVALRGIAAATGIGHSTAGVWGESDAQHGNGVFGIALSGNSKGVWGRSVHGRGVYGEATGTTGANYGVYGDSKSPDGVGVYGASRSPAGTGVQGTGRIGVKGTGSGIGVYASSTDIGVQGSGTNLGVFGSASGHHPATGVQGLGPIGVSGSGSTCGVLAHSDNFYGLFCEGHAYFNHNVTVLGDFGVGGTKQFLIDHPQDPANRTLAHACVEAPEVLNLYSGTATLGPKGAATVQLPRYFSALNREFRYQLTAIGVAAPGLHVARAIERNRFVIGGGVAGQLVCWQVTGLRDDAWMQAHPFRADRAKPRRDRGRYLNPRLFGEHSSAAIHPSPRIGRRGQAAQ